MALNDRYYMRDPQNNSSKSSIEEEIYRKRMEDINETKKRNESNASKKNENKKQYYSENMKDEIDFVGTLFKIINSVHAAIIDFSKSDTIFTNAFKVQCDKNKISSTISSYKEKINDEEHCICMVYTKEMFYYVDCKWKIIANSETDLELYYNKAKEDFIDSMANRKKSEKKEKDKKKTKIRHSNENTTIAKTTFFERHPVFKASLPILILVVLVYGGLSVYGIIKTELDKRENSKRLLMYQYLASTTIPFYSYRITDPSFIMEPPVAQEILRIKKEVNNQLEYGKSDKLSVTWLKKFDKPNDKKADCDDFAYLFWEKSQDSQLLKGKIFFATTDDEIFAHAFNLIWIGGEWRAIEPQNLDKVLDLSYGGYVNITKDAFNKWFEKHQVIIYDVGNMNYSRAAVPLFR